MNASKRRWRRVLGSRKQPLGGARHDGALVVAGFLFLCGGVLLVMPRPASAPSPASGAAPAPQVTHTLHALDSTMRAEAALREANYGEAQLQVMRARLQLKQVAREMGAGVEPTSP